jgi:hypothetical protein
MDDVNELKLCDSRTVAKQLMNIYIEEAGHFEIFLPCALRNEVSGRFESDDYTTVGDLFDKAYSYVSADIKKSEIFRYFCKEYRTECKEYKKEF